ncbi:hypothetical protein DL89DRAFT_292258 [Linderina pennispora]|uniref:UBX domain-containing protein n=1 Tax=Linderina pennispora TaxID=61395 RepID=A0A1Y1WBJ3_9FUNG|nr:uncharacterized protein DL89DRAFT_292258 [Linderina pennispora]ORX70616.1 hypothetical protein DL89DRAFT_292258 [Linderina pennispora]
MSTLTIIYGPGRTVAVKTTPTMTLQAVLTDACAKVPGSPAPASHILTYNDKALDLSLPLRFANLPQGVKLTLKRTASKPSAAAPPVKVALQVSDSGRVIVDVPAATTLWEIVTLVEQRSNGALNLTSRFRVQEQKAGLLKTVFGGSPKAAQQEGLKVYQQPVLLILNKEISDIPEMKTTSLQALGFAKGSVMIRLSFKDADVSLAPPVASVPVRAQSAGTEECSPMNGSPAPRLPPRTATEPPRSTRPESPPAAKEGKQPELPPRQPPARQPNIAPTAADTPRTHSGYSSDVITNRQVQVFASPTQTSAPLAARFVVPDSFYELKGAELQGLVSAQRKRQMETEAGFKLRSVEEEKARRRIEEFKLKHPKTMIRFRFPDLVQVQAVFLTLGKVQELYDFLDEILEQPSAVQALVLQPPVQDLRPSQNKTLYDAKLTPAAVVHVRLVNSKAPTMPLLKPHIASLAATLDVPTEVEGAAQLPTESPSPTMAGEASRASSVEAATKSTKKVPKWFMAGKK